ncbi:Hypothetical predicted protein, partial [Mytilus galloprovincialis]
IITSTRNGNIHVADCHPSSDSGRVVVLGQGGDIINTYTGHAHINKDKQFRPVSIVTTPKDNVIVPDKDTHSLHILDRNGHLMAYYSDNNVKLYPCTLAFTPTGQLYMGCGRTKSSTSKEAKIHDVAITEC